nr:hypothetical protein [uncultured Agathobaculum sp.]
MIQPITGMENRKMRLKNQPMLIDSGLAACTGIGRRPALLGITSFTPQFGHWVAPSGTALPHFLQIHAILIIPLSFSCRLKRRPGAPAARAAQARPPVPPLVSLPCIYFTFLAAVCPQLPAFSFGLCYILWPEWPAPHPRFLFRARPIKRSTLPPYDKKLSKTHVLNSFEQK